MLSIESAFVLLGQSLRHIFLNPLPNRTRLEVINSDVNKVEYLVTDSLSNIVSGNLYNHYTYVIK
jgi:hypothetical protein